MNIPIKNQSPRMAIRGLFFTPRQIRFRMIHRNGRTPWWNAAEVANKTQRRPARGGVVLRVPGNPTAPNHLFGCGTVAMVSRIRLAIL